MEGLGIGRGMGGFCLGGGVSLQLEIEYVDCIMRAQRWSRAVD